MDKEKNRKMSMSRKKAGHHQASYFAADFHHAMDPAAAPGGGAYYGVPFRRVSSTITFTRFLVTQPTRYY